MSSYEHSYSTSKPSNGSGGDCSPEFAAEFPNLATVFSGVYEADTGNCKVPRASIILFWEGGKLKFCISPKVGSQVAFGTVEDETTGLAGVEAAVALGHFEWKKGKR